MRAGSLCEGRDVSRGHAGGGRDRWSAHPSSGVEGRGHAQYPAFVPNTLFLLPALQQWQLEF